MAEYKSNYTGQEIDAGIGKANTAVQPADLSSYQEKLVSGENIKTINGTSILGEGNMVIEGGSGGLSSVAHDNTMTGAGTNESPLGVDTTKIAQKSDIPDISTKQDKIDSSHKLSADLVDDTSSTNKFVTASDKTTWNGKSVVSGTNDGTNWTALTIDGTTKNIPAGGSGGESDLFIIDIEINPYTTDTTFASPKTIQFVATPEMPGAYMGTVPNMPQGPLSNIPDIVRFTYNGTSYDLPLIESASTEGNYYYGEADFSSSGGGIIFDNYPFFFAIIDEGSELQGMIATNINQSEMQLWIIGKKYRMYGTTINNRSDIEYDDIIDALEDGKIPIVRYAIPAIPGKTYYATVYGEIGEENINFRGDYDDDIALDFKNHYGSGGFDVRGYLKELPIECTTGSGGTIDFSVDLYAIKELYKQQEYYIELDGVRYETTKTTLGDDPLSFGITGTYLDSANGKLKELSLTYTYPTTKTANLEEFDVSGSGGSATDVQINGTSIVSSGTANIVTETAYNASSNKIATMSDVGTSVTANPTLDGGEDALESIQIGSTKYDTKGIYPVSMSVEQTPAQTETVTTTTTVFGDMTGDLTDTSVYAPTTTVNVTFWDANLEPNRIGSKLKSVFIAAPSSAVNKTLSIVGSTSPVGEPSETKDQLAAKAQAALNNYSIICTITLKEGLNEYTLDGNDANVSIVTQSMINSAPQSIGYFHPNASDTGGFYFIAYDNTGNDWGGYWNQGAKAFHRTLGINWKYENEIEISPAENDLVITMNNGDDISCSLDDVPITVETASPLLQKRIGFVGDSITDTTACATPYWTFLQTMTGCYSISYGIDGSTISNQTNHDPMYARISNVSINCDAVVVFGGTNDFGLDVPLGDQYTTDANGVRTLNTDTSTFWGAVNQMCINLQDRFATKSIYLCTPIRRGTFKTNPLNDNKPNGAGKYLNEYADAIRKACEWFSFNLIDLYATSGLYPYDADNASTYYLGLSNSGDYLHPNATGHQRIAKVMKLALEKTFIE